MSAPVVIGLVCEGESDAIVLQAVLDQVFGVEGYRLRPLRLGHGRHGPVGGKSAVQRWCERHGPEIGVSLLRDCQLLIVHLDADARKALKIATTKELCEVIQGWLGLDRRRREDRRTMSPRLIIVIPKEATDTWLLATLGSANPQLESAEGPRARLVAAGELPPSDAPWSVRRERYAQLSARLAAQLPQLGEVLFELRHFLEKLSRFRAGPSPARAPEAAAGRRG
ncbi:hypothetical protein WMF31_00425 [Sorangium sp. So ce1036]|uniref:hypothetical protein n=1 Tax=Sorangium TaxID=39643 RepID=UPI001012B483|nr:hypothetical protein [Sorangium cellulosum]